MSEGARRFLRSARVGGAVTLGVDGHPRVADDPLSGIVGGTPAEMQAAVDIVEAAQRRADELVRRATLEASAIRDRARSIGHEEGYRAGAGAARTELARALALVQRVAAEGHAIREELLRRSEREIVELVVAGLRTIAGEWAERDPEFVQQTVRRALDRAGSRNVVRIRLHPDQSEGVMAYLAASSGEAPAFEVFADGSVGVGGCVVDTEHGRVDARLDVQLDAVALLLREALPVEPHPVEQVGPEAADAA